MPLPLTRDHVDERLRNYTRDNYLYIGSIIKGIALAVATLVGFTIFSDLGTYWPRVAPWIASLLAITVTYMTWGSHSLLANARSNLWDSVIPWVMGLFEFALFGILSPNNLLNGEHPPLLWQHWFLILALHTLFAVLLVTNRVKNTKIEKDFDSFLHSLAEEYMKWLRNDQIGAAIVSGASLVVWIILIWLVWPLLPQFYAGLIYTILAGLAGCFLLKPIYDADNNRRRIDEFVSQ